MADARDLLPVLKDLGKKGGPPSAAKCFIAASYDDQPLVDELIAGAEAGFKARNAKQWAFLRQPQGPENGSAGGLAGWEVEAESMIRASDAVLCIAGPGFATSEGLRWELRVAEALGKPIVVLAVDPAFKPPDGGLGRAILIRELRPAEAGSRIDSLVLSAALAVRSEPADTGHLLEQYRLIIETAERLDDRRQTLHTFYLSINSLLLAAIGLVAKAAIDGEALVFLGVPLVAALGWLLASTWARQIRSYGQVRNGKFAIVNAMEAQLPAAPFVAEWIAMLQLDYESFTASEQRVPHAFATLYGVAFVAAPVLAFLV